MKVYLGTAVRDESLRNDVKKRLDDENHTIVPSIALSDLVILLLDTSDQMLNTNATFRELSLAIANRKKIIVLVVGELPLAYLTNHLSHESVRVVTTLDELTDTLRSGGEPQ